MRFLYHYYEYASSPFAASPDTVSRVEMEPEERMRKNRERRAELEAHAHDELRRKGGFPVLRTPNYFVVGESQYLEGRLAKPAVLRVPIEAFDVNTLTFTFGDLVAAFDDPGMRSKPYGATVFTYAEILEMIRRYGLPQIWNEQGKHGPERYIQAQCWMDAPFLED
jgi:hypothetical protein